MAHKELKYDAEARKALEEGVDVQQLKYEKLRDRLLKDRQVLEYNRK